MQLLPGFRDFYPQECARRNYILATWREVARRYGFVEYDGPLLEPIELYKKKSGGELVGQLFDFMDKGERHVALRPEMTPTLARMVAARERDFKKPLKWFCLPQFFRYEKPQRGRGREFYQLNADIIGEGSQAAEAELIALLIDSLRAFSLTEKDFVVRIGSRAPFQRLFGERAGNDLEGLMQIIDKIDRTPEEKTDQALQKFGMTLRELREMLRGESGTVQEMELAVLWKDLSARGLKDFVELDLTVVRGLAYYTGVVFEASDRSKNERAIAGGGRYDELLKVMSDGKVDLPALGFGMGDVVLANLIDDTPAAASKMQAWIAQHQACAVYVVIAKEARRLEAFGLVQRLRDCGMRVDFPLSESKVGKQFQAAEQIGATFAVLVGDEWPQVKVKTLATREERLIPYEQLESSIRNPKSEI